MRNLIARGLLLAGLLAMPTLSQAAAPASTDPLFATVEGLDRTLFDAYNACDLKVMGDLVSDDLEFYHDKTGLAVGRAPFVESIRTNICGKVRRTLVPGTLEVYPLHDYGAVEIGVHRFCDIRKFASCDENNGGDAKFVMLWRQTPTGWKLTRVISFDHLSRPQ
jgi:hypothetical protein